MFYLLATLWDALTTLGVIERGGYELNPMMAPLVGTIWFFLVKLGLALAVVLWCVFRSTAGWKVVLMGATTITAAVGLWNMVGILANG